jgi:integrase
MAAAKSAGLEGLLPHDLRRSAIRNFTKAGVGESEGMAISGHRINSVYKRYNIIDEDTQRKALEKVEEFQKREPKERKVVLLRQAGRTSTNS